MVARASSQSAVAEGRGRFAASKWPVPMRMPQPHGLGRDATRERDISIELVGVGQCRVSARALDVTDVCERVARREETMVVVVINVVVYVLHLVLVESVDVLAQVAHVLLEPIDVLKGLVQTLVHRLGHVRKAGKEQTRLGELVEQRVVALLFVAHLSLT